MNRPSKYARESAAHVNESAASLAEAFRTLEFCTTLVELEEGQETASKITKGTLDWDALAALAERIGRAFEAFQQYQLSPQGSRLSSLPRDRRPLNS